MTGGRDGRATSSKGSPDLVIKPPAELGGPADMPEATNPEELFALGYGACYLSALSLVARGQKISAKEFSHRRSRLRCRPTTTAASASPSSCTARCPESTTRRPPS